MEVTYELNANDFYDGGKACSRTKTWETWTIWAIFAAFGCLIAWMVFLNLSSGLPKFVVAGVAVWIFALVCLSLASIMRHSAASRQFKNNPSAKGRVTLTVLENGIHQQSQHDESTMNWSSFVAWYEGKSVLMLMKSSVQGIVVPKRAFTPDQLTEFIGILRSRVRSEL